MTVAVEQEKQEALSVTAALALAKGALEGVTVRLIGEVSELSNKPGYKAVYFTVKDKQSALPCMMWNNRYTASGVRLEVGNLVELTGRFTLYAAKGRMNFDVFSLSLAGEGNLRLQVANLARKLQAEGLMDPTRKRPLPLYPERVGLVTSPRGDAVHDVLRTMRRRFPAAQIVFAGVTVEGKTAPTEMIRAMDAVFSAGVEVLLLVRGGGSYEDLMPFNDETLARAIAAAPVPVVTGIGHEPDTCIADMVADVRASTPTHAAMAVSPAWQEVKEALSRKARTMQLAARRVLDQNSLHLRAVVQRPLFADSSYLFASEFQGLDWNAERLSKALPNCLHADSLKLAALKDRFTQAFPAALSRDAQSVQISRTKLLGLGKNLIPRFGSEVSLGASRLHDLSPLTVLSRGYAIARNETGSIVKSVHNVFVGSTIQVSLSDGELDCTVDTVREISTSLETLKE